VTKFPRRKFLKTIGAAAVASALPNVTLGAQPQQPSAALFWEPGFRAIQGPDLTLEMLQQGLKDFTVTSLNERELIAQLSTTRFDLLVTPYGSAFPRRAWPTILKYLLDGGNWLNIGGVPLSRPIIRERGSWLVEPKQATYHKRLGITHWFPVNTSTYTAPLYLLQGGFKANEVYELYVRLSSSNNEPDEAGSDGPHEGIVQPVVTLVNADRQPMAAPFIQIDRLLGEFAGGRWVLANFNGTIEPAVIANLASRATLGASRFEVRSDFACYKPGEVPVLSVELFRPKGDFTTTECSIEVSDKTNTIVSRVNTTLKLDGAKAVGSVKLPDAATLKPGFYKISAEPKVNPLRVVHQNGFWIYDDALLARGKPLTVDKHFFYRDGAVFPVTGTTYMASDKHRRFLFEPNAFVWDKDFRAMKAAGVNMVRTGIWTAWKKYMPQPGKVDEAVLRAFDAFLLTAHQYDIPVVFTFFAFLPETWGGENAYLDPRSVKAQQQFVSAFTERCRKVDDVMWDLINEPSFCSPKFLWNCRPNYDAHEKAEWTAWLKNQYPATTEQEQREAMQLAWRTTSDDVFELPRLQDFESVNLIDDRLPLKTLDYRLFAQDMFIRWIREMRTAIRSNGNQKQLITVGQDEAGLADSPNMQFFANEVDFGSLHNWWNNDDLVWDSVLGKTPSKLNLMEETGVMFYEKADGGAPWRSEEDVSNLLERKLAISFAADGAGFIEWIWNTNPYMNSTNEVGIGFHRVDGSAKPELEPFLRIAKFMSQYGQYLKDRVPEQVAMIIPHSQMFLPRSFASEATRRCVRAMYYHCGVPMQAVSEYKVPEYLDQAKLIIIPSPVVLAEKSWVALVERIGRGATVALSGALDLDALPASKFSTQPLKNVPVAQSEIITISGQEYRVRYEGEKMQRLEKAVDRSSSGQPVQPFNVPYDTGRLVWSPLPLELGDSMSALAAFYNFALSATRISPIFAVTPRTPDVLVLPSLFRDVVLYTFVSETDRDTQMQVTHLESRTPFTVSIPAQRTAMVLLERKSGKIIGRM
jgi:Cellulase (glycosyl hydrolase family 5)